MGISLTPEEQFEILGTDKLGEATEEARQLWGETAAWQESQRRSAAMYANAARGQARAKGGRRARSRDGGGPGQVGSGLGGDQLGSRPASATTRSSSGASGSSTVAGPNGTSGPLGASGLANISRN